MNLFRALVLMVGTLLCACSGPKPVLYPNAHLQSVGNETAEQDIEASIVEREAGIAHDLAVRLVKLGGKIRHLKNHGLEEGVSTRLLIYAGTLIREGIAIERACDVAIARPITDDADMQRSIMELVKAVF
jgi:hypothetical protein